MYRHCAYPDPDVISPYCFHDFLQFCAVPIPGFCAFHMRVVRLRYQRSITFIVRTAKIPSFSKVFLSLIFTLIMFLFSYGDMLASLCRPVNPTTLSQNRVYCPLLFWPHHRHFYMFEVHLSQNFDSARSKCTCMLCF